MQGLGPQDADSSRILREMAAGALRRWGLLHRLQALMSQRETAPEALSFGDCLLRVSLSWMIEQPHKTAVVVDQAVECAKRITPKTSPYTNALLRRFSREREALLERAQAFDEAIWNVPAWWLESLRLAYPARWAEVLKAAAMPSTLSLRVNRRKTTARALAARFAEQGYQAQAFGLGSGAQVGDLRGSIGEDKALKAHAMYVSDALYLPPSTDPKGLPGFSEGLFSVQDLGAQQAAWLLDLEPGMRVLDACAAPGGKTGHILELVDCDLQAWDLSAKRLERLAENLKRLDLHAQLACVDLWGPEVCRQLRAVLIACFWMRLARPPGLLDGTQRFAGVESLLNWQIIKRSRLPCFAGFGLYSKQAVVCFL